MSSKRLFQIDPKRGYPVTAGPDLGRLIVQMMAHGRWPSESPQTVGFTVMVPNERTRQKDHVDLSLRIRGLVVVPSQLVKPGRDAVLLMAECHTADSVTGNRQIANGSFCFVIYDVKKAEGVAYFQDADPLGTPIFKALAAGQLDAFEREPAMTSDQLQTVLESAR